MQDLLKKPQPSIQEFAFMMFVGISILVLLTWSDINLHDYYVKPDISHCYPSMQDRFCTDLRKLHGLPSDAQLDIGDVYAKVVVTQAFTLALLMIFMRLFITYMTGGKITVLAFFTALLWGFTSLALFSFGFVDYGYYTLRGMEVPEKLAWLNDAGFFNYTRQLGNDTNTVEKSDLYITMAIGVILLLLLWALALHHYKKGTLKKVGLI